MRDHAFPMQGGLNLAGLTLALKPGEATLLENFECLPHGGYRRYDGYERFDGRPEPHKATYNTIPFTTGQPAGIAVGDTITGATSGAAAHVLAVVVASGSFAGGNAAGTLVVDRVTGTFAATENLLVGGTTRAFKSGALAVASMLDASYDDWLALAADSARALIQSVPGEGDVLGAAIYKGKVYAFRNVAGGASATMWESSSGGWVAKKTGLAPNGRYEFVVHNFKGSASTKMLYGVSGTHKAFQWDGTTWTDITTGMTVDKPTHIAVHRNYLFLAFPNGSLQNSPVGDPTAAWTLRTGAAEFGIGDEITALRSVAGGVLAIYCKDSTHLLYGAGTSTWELKRHSDEAGAYPYSVQEVPGSVLAVDNRGLMPLQTTQSFGDFSSATVSQRVQPLLDARRGRLVDSLPVKAKSQYRALFDDGTVLTVTYRGSKIVGYSMLRFTVFPTCAFAGEDASGNEMLVMGAADGYVYRLDVGYSFDGVPIECLVRTASDPCGALRRYKHFTKLVLQVQTPRPLSLLVQPEFDFSLSEADVSQAVATDASSSLANTWDVGNWDEMVWDASDERPGVSNPELDIDGDAQTVAFLVYHGGQIKPPFTIESGVVILNDRGFAR